MPLTRVEKDAAMRMRADGAGYKTIATTLGTRRDMVRSFLAGLPAPTTVSPGPWCRWCGVRLDQAGVKRGAKFCCEEHRRCWWACHREAGKRLAIYEFTCAYCALPFSAYGNQDRKYCSHACYVRHRFATRGGRS